MNDTHGQNQHVPAYNVELHIDEIVLYGFAHRDRYAIQEAIQRELTRLIGERGIAASFLQGSDAERLDAGTVTIQQGMPPDAIGTQVAQTVYRGLEQRNAQSVSRGVINNAPTGRSTQQ